MTRGGQQGLVPRLLGLGLADGQHAIGFGLAGVALFATGHAVAAFHGHLVAALGGGMHHVVAGMGGSDHGFGLGFIQVVVGVAFGLDGQSLLALGATLLVGTPTLSLIGGLAAALTLGARKSGALLALLALPLCVPTLIFGAGAIETLAAGDGIVTHVAILAALALVALATTPWAIAAALRQAGE